MAPDGEVESRMTRITGLIQQTPEDGKPASQRTEAYLGYDDKNLYVVFVAFDDEPDKVRANLSRRERTHGDDIVEIMIDTFNDQRRAYAFVANPFGVQWDAIWFEGWHFDGSFDTVWESDGRLTDRGYVVRMAIPFKSLRFPATEKQTWGFILVRDIERNNETSFWPRVSSRIEGRLNQAARLEGIENVSPGRNVQVIPYATSSSFRFLDVPDDSDPRYVEDDLQIDVGVDAKLVFRDALVLDLTANPDFSQVESDQPQVTVNQRFEVFFREKRPFFLENASYFRTPLNLLFTRRIIEPRAGARLTGKIGPWTLGTFLIDDEAPGKVAAAGDPLRGEDARIGAFRLSRDVLTQSSVGVMLTGRELGDGYNRVASVDGRFKLSPNWVTSFQAVASRTREQDGTRLSAPAYEFQLERQGIHFSSASRYRDIHPDFRSELGFIRRTDIRDVRQAFEYAFRPEGKRLVAWGPGLLLREIWDHDGTRLDWTVRPRFFWEFRGQTEFGAYFREGRERLRPEDFEDLTGSLDFKRRTAGLFFETRFIDALSAHAVIAGGRSVNFVTPEGEDGVREPPEPADITAAEVELSVRPTRKLRVDNLYLLTRLSDRDDGGRIFSNQIARSRLNYQFNRKLTLRAIFQYETTRVDPERTSLEQTERFGGEFLMAYLVNPWTALYVGYNDNYSNLELVDTPGGTDLVRTDGDFLSESRELFVKFSYLFRL